MSTRFCGRKNSNSPDWKRKWKRCEWLLLCYQMIRRRLPKQRTISRLWRRTRGRKHLFGSHNLQSRRRHNLPERRVGKIRPNAGLKILALPREILTVDMHREPERLRRAGFCLLDFSATVLYSAQFTSPCATFAGLPFETQGEVYLQDRKRR